MWEILIIILCLGVNAFLAATELAFVAMNKARLRHLIAEGNEHAEKLLSFRENPERILSVLQLGITFVGVVAAAVGGVGSGNWLTPIFMRSLHVSESASLIFAVFLFVIPYTFLSVLLSELLPKSLALRNPKWVLFHAKKWIIILGKIFAPFVFLLEKSTKWCARWFFPWVKYEEMEGEFAFPVGKIVRPYILRLAKIDKSRVVDVMLPWSETDTISKGDSLENVKAIVLKTKHTRLPVLEGKKPIGLLQAKEFLSCAEQNDPNWQDKIFPLIKLTESNNLLDALKKMQASRCHMSIVFKEEEPIGIVTIEDILEEVVGEIYDEDDLAKS